MKNNSPQLTEHADTGGKEPNTRILIVEDDPGIQDIFSIIFSRAGYEAEIKSGGEDLLGNNFSLPDVFLIDKQLAGTSGLDICRHLKGQANTKDIPLIMISASPDIETVSQQAGADAYIEKPFNIDRLLALVRSMLQERTAS